VRLEEPLILSSERFVVVGRFLWRVGLPCVGLRSSPGTDNPDLPENTHCLQWGRCALQCRANLLATGLFLNRVFWFDQVLIEFHNNVIQP
jgi:hypothetical protein